jgi:hypothetical protein
MRKLFIPLILCLLLTFTFANFSWIDLSDTDSDNWVSTSQINSVFTASDGNVYTGLANGKLGVYSPDTNVWTDLSATDIGNWVGTSSVMSVFESSDGNIYTGLNGGKFGVYSPDTNVWTDLSSTDAGNWASNFITYSIDEYFDGNIYTGTAIGKLGVYSPITNVWTDLSSTDAGNWVASSNIESIYISSDGNIYTGIAGGKFGVYSPITNVWTNLSTTDNSNWVGTDSVYSVFESSDGNIYTGIDSGKFGVYSPITNVWTDLSSTDIGNWVRTNPVMSVFESSNGNIYTGMFKGLFGVYSPDTNVWTNLSATDPANWVGTSSVYSVYGDSNNNIYTGLADGKFGKLNPFIPSDVISPTTTFSGCTAGWHNTDKDITLSCDDGSGAGCDGTTYRIDGGAWNNYTIPFSLSTDLNHQIDYNSIDAVGNQETIKTSYCAIDKTAPTYTSIDNNGIIFYEPFEIQINGVNFDISGKALTQYRIDSGAWENFTIDYNVPITSDGNFLVDVNLVDNAGNQTLIENLEAFLMLPPNSTTFITPLEQIYYKGTIDNNIIFISWNEATHPAGRPITYDINYINSLGENTNLVSSSSDLNYSWDITLIDDGNYWLVGLVKDDRNLTANFSLDYNFTIQQYVEIPPSFETTAPTGSYDKRELIRVEFTILDANQSTFLVDINYSDTSNFGTGTILIQDENIATSSVVNCIQLGNNFSCYYDANLLSADDGDYYALVNVQGQGADASPQFNIYLGVDPEPAEESYSQRYINPNYSQRDENIYYNPATAYFLTDSEKQNIYLEQNTYLLIGVLIILGIGVFLLWKKRK